MSDADYVDFLKAIYGSSTKRVKGHLANKKFDVNSPKMSLKSFRAAKKVAIEDLPKSYIRIGGHPLAYAIAMKRIPIVKILLDHGADVDARVESSSPALTEAIQEELPEIVTLLLDRGANIEAIDHQNSTPLQMACVLGQEETIRQLLDRGANINAAHAGTNSPLMECLLTMSISESNMELIKFMLERGADPNVYSDVGMPALLEWLSLESEPLPSRLAVAELFIQKGADVKLKSTGRELKGETALHFAAFVCSEELASLLISKGADVNAAADDGTTPLFKVPDNDFTQYPVEMAIPVLSLLLAEGADINHKCTKDFDIEDESHRAGCTKLHCVTDAKFLIPFLLEHGADVNAVNSYNQTPVHMAASRGGTDAIICLTDAKPDLNIVDRFGMNALEVYKKRCFYHEPVACDLIEYLLDPKTMSDHEPPKDLLNSMIIEKKVKWAEALIRRGVPLDAEVVATSGLEEHEKKLLFDLEETLLVGLK